jgi:hypothetical protein
VKPLVLSVTASALFIAALLGVRPRWAAAPPERPATCLASSCFCEAPRPTPFRQPANTWSNVAYVAAGGALIASGSVAFGALCLLLGVGSAWFHATLSLAGEWLDVWIMFVMIGFLVARRIGRAGWVGRRGQFLVFAALSAVGAGVETFIPGRVYPFATVVGLLILVTALGWRAIHSDERRRFLWALVCFTLALSVWCLDRFFVWCSPTSLWQGHALWHVMCGATLFLLGLS